MVCRTFILTALRMRLYIYIYTGFLSATLISKISASAIKKTISVDHYLEDSRWPFWMENCDWNKSQFLFLWLCKFKWLNFYFWWTVPLSLPSDTSKNIFMTAQLSEDDKIWEPFWSLYSHKHFWTDSQEKKTLDYLYNT